MPLPSPIATVQRALLRRLAAMDDGRHHALTDLAAAVYITPAIARPPAWALAEAGLVEVRRGHGGKLLLKITAAGRAAVAWEGQNVAAWALR